MEIIILLHNLIYMYSEMRQVHTLIAGKLVTIRYTGFNITA